MQGTLRERFDAKVRYSDGGACWEWTGAIQSNGYGRFKAGDKMVYAHRLAYEKSKGEIPEGLQIDHLCRNRACVNPAHMEAVTRRTNILRGVSFSAVHARKTHCPQGHPYSEENTWRRPSGARVCLKCKRAHDRERYYRVRGRPMPCST